MLALVISLLIFTNVALAAETSSGGTFLTTLWGTLSGFFAGLFMAKAGNIIAQHGGSPTITGGAIVIVLPGASGRERYCEALQRAAGVHGCPRDSTACSSIGVRLALYC